jgi:hypothetical protein
VISGAEGVSGVLSPDVVWEVGSADEISVRSREALLKNSKAPTEKRMTSRNGVNVDFDDFTGLSFEHILLAYVSRSA